MDDTLAPSAGMTRHPRRIAVMGTSGAGKSTLAADLASRLGLTSIELDALHHGPNWSAPTPEEFRSRVHAAMTSATAGYVIDGNYTSKLGSLVLESVDTIVWLDLPIALKLWRLVRRTTHRIRQNVELWNGNRETWRGALIGRQSLFVWTLRSHVKHRRAWPIWFTDDPRLVRLRSTAEVRRWLNDLSYAGGTERRQPR